MKFSLEKFSRDRKYLLSLGSLGNNGGETFGTYKKSKN